MLEASVLTISNDGEPVVPYYNRVAFYTYVKDYLKSNIEKYTKEYTVDFSYLKDDSNELCFSNCHSVRLDLKAKINLFYKYEKSQTFVVRSASDL